MSVVKELAEIKYDAVESGIEETGIVDSSSYINESEKDEKNVSRGSVVSEYDEVEIEFIESVVIESNVAESSVTESSV